MTDAAIASQSSAQVSLPDLDIGFNDIDSVKRACAGFCSVFEQLRAEVGKVIIGQHEIIEQTLIALFADGHVLLEGVPGLGKTLLVRTLSRVLKLPYSRIQFTPDLMPADITGTSVVVDDPETNRRSFTFRPGPIFNQLVLADEINRATPKSQAALLEAMQERSVTIAGKTHQLDRPFFVLGTQNPIEQEGTYPLPEAQLDRFLFKISVPYATRQEMNKILTNTTGNVNSVARPFIDGAYIDKSQRLAQQIVVAPHVQDYAIRLVMSTHPTNMDHSDPKSRKYIRIGVSPRGAQAMICAGKVKALIDGRFAVSFKDITDIAFPALRHRIIHSFEAEADGITCDDIIARLIECVPREAGE